MKKLTLLITVITIALLLLPACQIDTTGQITPEDRLEDVTTPEQDLVTASPTFTEIPSSTPVLTPTETNTPYPTPTYTPTFGPSPTPSLTPTLSGWIEEDFLFGGPTIPGCELPCWQGLVPGKSTPDEIDQTFQSIFGTGRIAAALDGPVDEDQYNTQPLWDFATSKTWEFDTDASAYTTGPDRFTATAYVDGKTYLLGAVHFRWAGISSHYTPAMLIREFGEPSRFLIHIPPNSQMGNRFIQLFLIYDKGIIYTAWMVFPEQSGGVEICLEGLYWNGQYDSEEREIVLTTPIGDEFPIPAHEFLEPIIYKKHWASFEDKLGVPLAEVTETVQSDEPACWFYEGD